MKRRMSSAVVVALVLAFVVAAGPALAQVKLPAVISSGMVLQREMPILIWGSAKAGEKVTVKLDGKVASAAAGADGKWNVTLPAMKADGKAHTLTVSGTNTITLDDILIGEVWVGSGQSNMAWPLSRATGGKEAIAASKCPQIRLFNVPRKQAAAPADDVSAAWQACGPDTVGNFSAVLYFFGQRLHKELKVPIGLINSSWGGSPIEPWTVTASGSGGMYNGMIAPLQPFAIRGAIWYQGETNVIQKNGLAYADKMKDLIEGWRRTWSPSKGAVRDLAFYYVAIAPWGQPRYEQGQLPAVWEAKAACLKIPHTGMVVITDLVDNINDIHPVNKLPVGNRLALWALAKDYGRKDLVYSGPLYKSMKVEGDKIRLEFAHVGGGLKSRDGKELTEFQIAGSDGAFSPAKAVIDGKTVLVSADGVKAPAHVRFGWHKKANPNLINAEALPASPFHTDNWTGGTGE